MLINDNKQGVENMNLRTKLKKLLSDTLRMCDSCEQAEKLKKEIENMQKRLDEPLRLAVAGVVKAGKSTLMNAIMKEKILFTGGIETTSNPSWFKYAPSKSITVVFKDETEEDYAFEDLEKWTVKLETDKNPRAKDVKYVEIKYPNEVLKTMELIDTPGFEAGSDASEKSMEFFGFKKDSEKNNQEIEANKITVEEASEADAVIYAFSKGAQSSDRNILEAFQGDQVAPNTSPVNAVGVFTKSDILWDMMDNNDPMETANQVTKNLMEEQNMKSLLYTITPVSARIVESVSELKEEEWKILERLSKLDENLLFNILFDKNTFIENEVSDFENDMETKFTKEERENMCSKEERKEVCLICEQYGIYIITKALKEGISKAEIIEYMYKKSGIKDLSDLIYNHFGNRAFIIKLRYVFSHLSVLARQIMNSDTTDDKLYDICEYLKEEIDNIQSTEHVFKELKILQNYYNGLLKCNSEHEVIQLMQITGENGRNCEAKLGVPEGSSIKELANLAKERIKYWNEQANDILIERYYEEAAQVLSRSCDIMYFHLKSLLDD